MKTLFRCAVAVVSLGLAVGALAQTPAPPTSLTVRGDVQKPGVLTPEDVKKQFAAELHSTKYTAGHDKQEKTAVGVPLVSVIKAAELKTAPTPKHYDLSFIVILEAHDGYRAFFSMAELSKRGEENKTLLVVEEDGKPLSGQDAPFKLLTEGGDRRIFGITGITLVDGIKLSDGLGKK
ncbi:MAG: hypothetical protein LBT74_09910 [Acidobacteriota bacterium]|jgi:hypothetical protein|nr:hypothetical protein [Acidobacteriota bacterium]